MIKKLILKYFHLKNDSGKFSVFSSSEADASYSNTSFFTH